MAIDWKQSLRTAISAIRPSTWFSPLQPLVPMAPQGTAGRQWDYQVGENIIIRTRPPTMLPFAALRKLAETCDILRLVIETRKDQVEALKWEIVAKDPEDKDDKDPKVIEIENFFKRPDRIHNWGTWIKAVLEDMFVIDAMTLYKRRDMVGRLYSLDLMDGALMKVLIDDHGRIPEYPDPSYQQLIKGLPAVDYDTSELLYRPRTVRTWSVYGYSITEQILVTVESLLNRARFNANYYVDGNTPDMIGTLPPEMTVEEVKAFQSHWDSILKGNLNERRGMKWIPGGKGSKFQEIKQPPLKDEFDEWLARIVCYAFSVAPTPFIKQMNRATAESSQEAAAAEGLTPITNWIKGWMDELIEQEFDTDKYEFAWKSTEEQNQLEAATIRQGDVKAGIITPDEAREELGLDPKGGAAGELGVITANGFTTLEMAVEQAKATHEASIDAIKNPKPVMVPGAAPAGGAKPPEDDKPLKKKTLYR